MGQCMVISAVFEPRGRAYHVPRDRQQAGAETETESQRARVPTVFAYGTPRTCEVRLPLGAARINKFAFFKCSLHRSSMTIVTVTMQSHFVSDFSMLILLSVYGLVCFCHRQIVGFVSHSHIHTPERTLVQPLRRKGKAILSALFQHTREEVALVQLASGASPSPARSRRGSMSLVSDSPPLPHQPFPSSSSSSTSSSSPSSSFSSSSSFSYSAPSSSSASTLSPGARSMSASHSTSALSTVSEEPSNFAPSPALSSSSSASASAVISPVHTHQGPFGANGGDADRMRRGSHDGAHSHHHHQSVSRARCQSEAMVAATRAHCLQHRSYFPERIKTHYFQVFRKQNHNIGRNALFLCTNFSHLAHIAMPPAPFPQSATPGPSSPALSTVSSTAYSSYSAFSSASSTYGGSASFPSLAESREVAMMESGGGVASASLGWSPSASHAHFASNPRGSGHSHSNHGLSSGPVSKIQAFTELTDERRAHLSAKFRFDPALLAPILAHFLKAARVFSPHARQYVISEAALAAMLRSQVGSDMVANRQPIPDHSIICSP
jgi:hypothetical protein